MRHPWESLYQDLLRSIRTLESEQRFRRARAQAPALARFLDPAALLAYLPDRRGDLDEKDAIYAGLIDHARAGTDEAAIAMPLLWLGMWPALDGIFRRRQRWFPHAHEQLVSEIALRFTTIVQHMDLSRVTRVAATLARSTERDLVSSVRAGWDEEARWRLVGDAPLPPPAGRATTRLAEQWITALGHVLSPEERVARLRVCLAPLVGQDLDLVIEVVVLGHSQRDLAAQLGISHDAARKRFQRALQKLRAVCPAAEIAFAFLRRTA